MRGPSLRASARDAARLASTAIAILLAGQAFAASGVACPPQHGNDPLIFTDGSILMSTKLAVNPDGAVASYTPGDHGYTYMNNGVNLIGPGGARIGCSEGGHQAHCREQWAKAEKDAFGPGTPEFCVYALEAEPVVAGKKLENCEHSKTRFTVGNGKGRPKAGRSIPNVSGASVTAYLSTTTLHDTRNGTVGYVDSAAIPGLVVPTSRPELVGALAWVRYGQRESYAIVSDTGPAFGEGSIALHQMLQWGTIGPLQPVGPIPLAMRCSAVETGLKAPFESKPDLGKDDKCRAGYHAKSSADIRGYKDIDDGVTSIILATVKPPMHGTVVEEELTPARLKDWAVAKGYTPDKLRRMAACLPTLPPPPHH